MKTNPASPLNRRDFFRQSACASLGLTGMVSTLAHLQLINAALAQSAPTDYKALVVLFLFGGNDSNNMLMPRMGHAEYNNYKSARGVLKIFDPTDTDPLNISAAPKSIALTSADGSYGVHPMMQPVADLFHAGDLGFVANTGTLAFPITRAEYLNNLVKKPVQLFSHSDQQSQWQSSLSDRPFTTGWGGRIADLLNAGSNPAGKVSMSVSLSGINSLQVGNQVAQYSVSPTGAVKLAGYDASSTDGIPYDVALNPDGTYQTTNHGKRLKAFDDVTKFTHAHLLEDGYNKVVKSARNNEGIVGTALTAAGTNVGGSGQTYDQMFYTPGGTTTSALAGQLKMVAKLIAGRTSLGNTRQIFFCSVGGYDTHSAQLTAHANLMTELSNGLAAFKNAMVALGVHDNVLTVSHSDFTRTLTPNGTPGDAGAGSDHGWGGHQIVMGGGVKARNGGAGRIYGAFPSLAVGTGQDVDANRGRWIPTTSVDQYAAVAANWLGVPSSALATIFPNLGRFADPFGGTANLLYV